ncbi:MAG: hypothetical protein RL095_3825 [Verrucomicrobiota bacterium]|jgi:hypothetical protein
MLPIISSAFLLVSGVIYPENPGNEDIIEEESELASDFSNLAVGGSSPVSVSTQRSQSRALNIAGSWGEQGQSAGEWFKDPELSLSGNYTSFDDHRLGSGHTRNHRLGASFTTADGGLWGFGMAESNYRAGFPSASEANTLGGDLWFHQELTEHFGLGAFVMGDAVDIEKKNGNSYSLGGGLLASSYHDLGAGFDFSTVHTLSYVDFDTDDDLTWSSLGRLAYAIDENWSCSAWASYNDSLYSHGSNDHSYVKLGADLTWQATESISFNLGYETTQLLEAYTDNSLLFEVIYRF